MSRLCEKCNGFTRLPPQYVLEEMGRHGQSPFMCPGHALELSPESMPKHDGQLDKENKTRVLLDREDNQVHIEDVWTDGISFEPAQALSLLAWLKQEEPELRKLVEEEKK